MAPTTEDSSSALEAVEAGKEVEANGEKAEESTEVKLQENTGRIWVSHL